MMKIAVGQEWELPSAVDDDCLLLRVVELVGDDRVEVHTVRRSDPKRILDRSTMWNRDLIDTGVLSAGPGAFGARRRRQQIARLSELLLYAARVEGTPTEGRDVRFDGRELVKMVAADEKVDLPHAQEMLRDALASLGGTEIIVGGLVYVIPYESVKRKAA